MFLKGYLIPLFCGLLLVAPVFGQEAGTIAGTVQDETGAVIPGAEVTLRNQGTGVTKMAVTNQAGRYSVPFLPPATYDVRVELPGFKIASVSGLRLEAGQTLAVNLILEVGEISEIVEVSAEQFALQTEDYSVADTINEAQVQGLPLDGRSFAQLAHLLPGVNPGTPSNITVRRRRGSGGTPVAVTANGFNSTQNKYSYDGVEAMDLDSYSFSFSVSIDSIQEFQVETSTYSASQGGAPGAHVNLVTKSGTNEFHGTLWEFNRNARLAAQRAFTPAKQPLNRNQFGANLGGPILKDRLFFFANWESGRVREASSGGPIELPPNPFRTGDFSSLPAGAQIIDPTTKSPFPNNVIPSNRISAATKAYLDAIVPRAQDIGDPPFNFILPQFPIPTDEDQFVVRIDHALSPTDSVFGRYIYNTLTTMTVPPQFGFDFDSNEGTSQNLGLSWSHTFSPAFVAETRFGWHRFFEHEFFGTTNNAEFDIATGRMNLPSTEGSPRNYGPPNISAGYTLPGVRSNGPRDRLNQMFDGAWNANYNLGAHRFHFGGRVYRQRWTFDEALWPRGIYSFDGRQTADRASPLQQHRFADFMLGLASSISLSPDPILVDQISWNIGAYVQDDFKVTPDLTLNFGLRYDWLGRPVQDGLRASNFFFENGDGLMVSSVFEAGKGEGLGDKTTFEDTNNFGPRVGFAWRPGGTEDFVIRAGYGIYYQQEITNTFTLNGFNPPWTRVFALSGTLENPLRYDDPALFSGAQASPLGAFGLWPDFADATAQQWNVTLQFKMPHRFITDIGYVGSHGDNLSLYYQANRPLALNRPGPIQPRRPLPSVGGVTGSGSLGWSRYDSLQMKVRRRVDSGISVLASYTYSKTLGTVSGNAFGQGSGFQDIYDEVSAKSLLFHDLKHRFSGTFLWDLPLLQDLPAVPRTILGGWKVNAITTFATGFATGAGYGVDTTNVGIGAFPDRIGDPLLPRDVRNAERWFNADAFAPPPSFRVLADGTIVPGRFGTSSWNTFWRPGINTVDFAALKIFPMPYAEGHQLEFRAEFFNLFNNVNLDGPATSIRSATVGKIRSAGDPRIIQFGLKYKF